MNQWAIIEKYDLWPNMHYLISSWKSYVLFFYNSFLIKAFGFISMTCTWIFFNILRVMHYNLKILCFQWRPKFLNVVEVHLLVYIAHSIYFTAFSDSVGRLISKKEDWIFWSCFWIEWLLKQQQKHSIAWLMISLEV